MESLVTGRVYSPHAVRTAAALTKPSGPGKTDTTRASGHRFRWSSEVSRIKTRSFSFRLTVRLVHLTLCWSMWRYSLDHLSQNWWYIACTRRQCWRCPKEGFCSEGSGMDDRDEPTRKCPGVRTSRSSGWPDSGVRGQELRVLSIWFTSVLNSS